MVKARVKPLPTAAASSRGIATPTPAARWCRVVRSRAGRTSNRPGNGGPARVLVSTSSGTTMVLREDGLANRGRKRMSVAQRSIAVAVDKHRKPSFADCFGLLGVPIAAVAMISFAWTAWLITFTVAPTRTANFLMGTEAYDDGRFWLITDVDCSLVVLSTAGFVASAIGYLYVQLKMSVWRNRAPSVPGAKVCASLVHWRRFKQTRAFQSQAVTTLLRTWKDVTGFNGMHRKRWNAFLKAVDLALQALSLHQMLESGVPVKLVVVYTTAICANALSVVFFVLTASHSTFTEIVVDSIFDMFFAVLIPIFGLAHSYVKFTFDHAEYDVNMEVMPAGSFERRARMVADPAQIARFQAGLDAVRILSMASLVIRIGMNLSFCIRIKRVVEVLIARHHRRSTQRSNLEKQPLLVHRSIALLFLLFSVAVAAYTHHAVVTSAARCDAYPTCISHAFQWRTDDLCPCLTLIDTDRTPTTYADWVSPRDVTHDVQALAAAGTLRTFQLINRQLLQWPDELRRCRELRSISLIYTGTEQVPTWAKEFRKLEYLHIEGRQTMRNLLELPDDLFEDMPALTFVQFGIHRSMERLPSLRGAPNLISLTVSRLFALTELPSFERLTKLERLELVYLPVLSYVPDMAPLKQLIHFAYYRQSHACCNGFVTPCDLTDVFCVADAAQRLPPATCLTNASLLISPATREVFATYSSDVCQRPTSKTSLVSDVPTQETIEMCDGVLYRECWLVLPDGTNTTGICYRSRMQTLSCTVDPYKTKLRRLQIERKVGHACDPDIEAWLGCTSTR